MPNILQEVFETHSLREPPWACASARKGANPADIAFWVTRRGWQLGLSKDGRRIYGEGLREGYVYHLGTIDRESS